MVYFLYFIFAIVMHIKVYISHIFQAFHYNCNICFQIVMNFEDENNEDDICADLHTGGIVDTGKYRDNQFYIKYFYI